MKYLLMKIPPAGTELEYDTSTYPTYYRFRKELQRFGLQMPNPNEAGARHFLLRDEMPDDPSGSIREGKAKRLMNLYTPEEQIKRQEQRLELAARKRDITIIKRAALQEIRRLESVTATQAGGSQKR